jgi:DNA-binding beta-propeller fold protein YncE
MRRFVVLLVLLAAASLSAQHVVSTTGGINFNEPFAVAVNPATNIIYVTDVGYFGSPKVLEIDGDSSVVNGEFNAYSGTRTPTRLLSTR